jgi:hypothetical protein
MRIADGGICPSRLASRSPKQKSDTHFRADLRSNTHAKSRVIIRNASFVEIK